MLVGSYRNHQIGVQTPASELAFGFLLGACFLSLENLAKGVRWGKISGRGSAIHKCSSGPKEKRLRPGGRGRAVAHAPEDRGLEPQSRHAPRTFSSVQNRPEPKYLFTKSRWLLINEIIKFICKSAQGPKCRGISWARASQSGTYLCNERRALGPIHLLESHRQKL